jgi:hypothetical protein
MWEDQGKRKLSLLMIYEYVGSQLPNDGEETRTGTFLGHVSSTNCFSITPLISTNQKLFSLA